MSIKIHEMKTPITVYDAVKILQRQTDEFGLFLDLDRIGEYHMWALQRMNNATNKLNKEHSKLYKFTDQEVIKYLKNNFNVDSYKFANKESKNLYVAQTARGETDYTVSESLDAYVRKNLQEDNTIDEEARELVKTYDEYKNARWMVGYIPQYYNCVPCNSLAYNGHRMVIAYPKWNPLRTNRISATEPSMQNIPRYMKDIITAPVGWKLVRADSDQIEPRITYSWFIPDELIKKLITNYGDAYAGIMHFSLMSDEEDRALREDFSKFKKMEITDDFTAKRKDFKVLTLAANYGSALKGVDRDIAEAYKRRIVQHPLRLQKEASVVDEVSRGVEEFYTAFGNKIVPEETTRYKKGTRAWKPHVERCGINNPIQGTASDLMMFSLNRAMEVIRKYPDTHIAFYKHDEGAFYVPENNYDEIKESLSDITAYEVDGWIPITCELAEGQLISEEVPSIL